MLEVSRNDAHYGEVVDELDCAVPNRNPDGELGCPRKFLSDFKIWSKASFSGKTSDFHQEQIFVESV